MEETFAVMCKAEGIVSQELCGVSRWTMEGVNMNLSPPCDRETTVRLQMEYPGPFSLRLSFLTGKG